MYLASEVKLTSLMSQTTILSPESDKKIGCAQCSSFFNLCSLSPAPLCGRFLKLLQLCRTAVLFAGQVYSLSTASSQNKSSGAGRNRSGRMKARLHTTYPFPHVVFVFSFSVVTSTHTLLNKGNPLVEKLHHRVVI